MRLLRLLRLCQSLLRGGHLSRGGLLDLLAELLELLTRQHVLQPLFMPARARNFIASLRRILRDGLLLLRGLRELRVRLRLRGLSIL